MSNIKVWQGLIVYILRALKPGIGSSILWPICQYVGCIMLISSRSTVLCMPVRRQAYACFAVKCIT